MLALVRKLINRIQLILLEQRIVELELQQQGTEILSEMLGYKIDD